MARKHTFTRSSGKALDEGTIARAALALLAVGMILGVLFTT